MRFMPCHPLQRQSGILSRDGARSVVGRFASSRDGSVLIEMSIVLLILITMLIGVTELSQALTLQRRVVAAAATAADLMTRATPAGASLGSSDLEKLGGVLDEIVGPGVTGSDSSGNPERLFGYKVTVFTVVEDESSVDGDEAQKTKMIDDAATVTYTCGSAGKSAVVIPPDLVNEVAGGGKIILVETRLKFTSAFTFFIKNAIDLDGSSFFIPRLDSELSLPASQNC